MSNYPEYNTPTQHGLSGNYASIPVIERVWRYINQFEEGQLIETTVRQLSTDIGVGRPAWGSITPALKRLQNDGLIAYTASRGAGTFIQKLGSDRTVDQPHAATAALACETPDRTVDHANGRKANDRTVDHGAVYKEDARVIEQESTMQHHQQDVRGFEKRNLLRFRNAHQ